MVSHCSTSPPRPTPFSLSLSDQKKFINGFSYINTIEKKEVWNLNYTGTKDTLAPWEFVSKCEPPQEAEALPLLSVHYPSRVLLTRKKVCSRPT